MTFRSAGAGVAGTGTSAAIPVGASAADKDVAILHLYTESADAIGSFNFAALGFTVKFDSGTANATTRGRLIVAYKRLTGADSGTYTVTWTTSAKYAGVSELHHSINQNGADPFEVYNTVISTSSSAVSIGHTVTTALAAGCDLVVSVTSHATNGGDFTPAPSGMTERFDCFALNGVGTLALYTQDAVAAGAQSKTTTTTGTTGNTYPRGFIGALKAQTVPDAPTLTANAEENDATADWTHAATGDLATSWDYRINGGSATNVSAATLTNQWTSLTRETRYVLEVRGVNAQGNGAWAAKTVITGSSNRRYFTKSGSWTPPANVFGVDVLVVGGGGSGGVGSNGGGGAGAGGVTYSPGFGVTPGSPVSITVGVGGAGVTGNQRGINGGSSAFDGISVDGGGGGGSGVNGTDDGLAGGSGGGNGGRSSGGVGGGTGGAATGNGLGFAGGAGFNTTINGNTRAGGGGGGASETAATANGTSSNGGEGGNGIAYPQFGTVFGESGLVGGGGGGGRANTSGNGSVGTGGTGGGGDGGFTNTTSEAGVETSGGGSGGTGNVSIGSAKGGDGIVIVQWQEHKAGWGLVLN